MEAHIHQYWDQLKQVLCTILRNKTSLTFDSRCTWIKIQRTPIVMELTSTTFQLMLFEYNEKQDGGLSVRDAESIEEW